MVNNVQDSISEPSALCHLSHNPAMAKGCPLAREIRKALRKKKINKKFKCVYSDEVLSLLSEESYCGTGNCMCPQNEDGPGNPELVDHEWCSKKARINGSIAHITAIFGFMLASLVIQSISELST